MKRIIIFTCQSSLLWHDAQALRKMVALRGGCVPMLVETGDTALLLEALEQELPNHDVFVLAVHPDIFHELKAQLTLCLGFVCEERPDIIQLQEEPSVEDASYPPEAHVFLTQSARLNGFALHSSRQDLLMLPLEAGLLRQIDPQLRTYLEAIMPEATDMQDVQSAEDPPVTSLDMHLMRLGDRYAASIDPIEATSLIPLSDASIIPLDDASPLAPIISLEQFIAEVEEHEPAEEMQEIEAPAAKPAKAAKADNRSEDQNRGRTRAVVAASLAFCSLVASLFLTFYYNNRTGQPKINNYEVTAALASNYLQLGGDTLEVEVANATVYESASANTYDAAAVNNIIRDTANATALRAREYLKAQIKKLIEAAIKLLPTVGVKPTKPPTTTTPTTTFTTTKPSSTTAPTTTTTRTPTTTTTTTTTAATTTTTKPPATKGVFYFEVRGFGHGVGLSQEGARAYARQGWSYEQIIKHYYYADGISIKKESVPGSITHAGKSYSVKEYIMRIALGEIGGPNQTADEAIKTQMVCAYTIAKKNGFKTTETNQHLLPDSQWNTNFTKQQRSKVEVLADAVLGRYVAYNNGVADALVFASCGGYTTSSKYAWGGYEPEAYLRGGRVSPETVSHSTVTLTKAEIQAMVKTYNSKYADKKITLGSDASQWIQILSKDSNGYVEQVKIGDRTLTGGHARLYFFTPSLLRAHNFTVTYQ